MTEAELRVRIAKRLHRTYVPEELWEYLVERRWIEGALQGEESLDEVCEEARRQLRLSQQLAQHRTPPGRTTTVAAPPKLQAHEQARAEAFSEILGNHIATIPRVRRLRADFFGGQIPSPAQAEAFLHSPALRFLSLEQLKELEIPILDHQASLVDEQENRTSAGRTVRVTLHIEWTDGTYQGTFHWKEYEDNAGTRVKSVVFIGPPGSWARQFIVWPMSVLGELHACGTWLAQFYPWGDAQAAWFLLTGNFPHVAPLELGMRARSHSDLQRYQITLTVEPWVSAETVLRAYRAVQGLVLDGRDNRPLRERSLALARFMASQRVAQGKRPPWKRLMDAWNRSYPQWYYSQVSNFAKDVDRAELALRFPKCDVPWGVQRWSGFTWHPSLRYVLGGPGDDPVEPQPASALEARCQELVAKQFDQGITSAEHAELRTLYQQRAARQQNLRLRGHKRPSDPSTRR